MTGSAAPQRSVAVLIAVAVLVVAVVAGVLVFGVNRPPTLATVADQPDPAPSASVAWAAWSDSEQCLMVARPEGTLHELSCSRDGADVVGWDDDGILVHRWDIDVVEVVDPETGDVSSSRTVGNADDLYRAEGRAAVRSRHDEGRLTVTLADGDVTLWEVDAPEVYEVATASPSPDGAWIALVDSAERLLLVPADGSAPPRVWADGVQHHDPVWEGTPAT